MKIHPDVHGDVPYVQNLYELKERVMQIEEIKRWLPQHLIPAFEELVNGSLGRSS